MMQLIDKYIGPLLYLFGILASAIAFLATYIEKKDIHGTKKKLIYQLTFWVAILGICALLCNWRKDIITDVDHKNEIRIAENNVRKLYQKTDTISTLQKYLQDSVSSVLIKQNISLLKLNSSIETQNKLVQTQRETIKHYFGEGFPIIHFSQRNKDFFDAYLLNSKNEYPLYDVQISAFNTTKLNIKGFRIENGIAFYHKDSLDKHTKELLPISVSPFTNQLTGYTIERKDLPVYITFKMIARNGPVYQYTIVWERQGLVYETREIYKPINRNFKLIFQDNPKIDIKIWEENFIYKKHYKPEYF